MPTRPWFTLLISLLLLFLLPFLFSEIMLGGLGKLHISPHAAVALMIAIVVGGFVNIPLKRIVHHEDVTVHPLALFGLADRWPEMRRLRRETIIAVNLGGCVIPAGVVIYELALLTAAGNNSLAAAAIICAVNTAVCYWSARPVPGVGIAMPGFLPAFIAAVLALLFVPGQAAPVAFIAGVVGPLVGADLMHLRDFSGKTAGIVSIGGAGTFDGIVLSGIVAAYMA